MVKKTFKIDVEPKIFEWLFRTSGYKPEDISKKLKIPVDTVEKWLKKEDKPTFEQVEKLSGIFKRPLASFLLSEAPEETKLPPDRRSLALAKPFSPKSYRAIRTARWVQSISQELMVSLKIDTKPQVEKVTSLDDPQSIARRERDSFGVSIDSQLKWKDSKMAFEQWREHIESKNIIVLHIPIPVDEVRGFSLTDKEPFVIVVSSSDDPNAKIFTLFHEYAHAVLKDASICNPFLEIGAHGDTHENWCDSFAGYILLPADSVRKDFASLSEMDLISKVTRISNMYKVSKYSVLVKLKNLNLIQQSEYVTETTRLMSKKRGKPMGRKLPAPRRCFQEKGQKFVSLVLTGAQERHITNSDALDYLSIKTKHLDIVRSMVKVK